MPRCVRNFWIEASIDGRRSSFASGPRGRDGGFVLEIHLRERGCVCPSPVRISGRRFADKLFLTVEDGARTVFVQETER